MLIDWWLLNSAFNALNFHCQIDGVSAFDIHQDFSKWGKKLNTGWCQMPVLNLFYSELSVTPSILSKSCIGVNGRLSLKIEHSPFFDLNLWLCQWHLEHLKLYLALLKAQTKDSHPESTGNVKSRSSLILNRTNHVSSVFVCLFSGVWAQRLPVKLLQ